MTAEAGGGGSISPGGGGPTGTGSSGTNGLGADAGYFSSSSLIFSLISPASIVLNSEPSLSPPWEASSAAAVILLRSALSWLSCSCTSAGMLLTGSIARGGRGSRGRSGGGPAPRPRQPAPSSFGSPGSPGSPGRPTMPSGGSAPRPGAAPRPSELGIVGRSGGSRACCSSSSLILSLISPASMVLNSEPSVSPFWAASRAAVVILPRLARSWLSCFWMSEAALPACSGAMGGGGSRGMSGSGPAPGPMQVPPSSFGRPASPGMPSGIVGIPRGTCIAEATPGGRTLAWTCIRSRGRRGQAQVQSAAPSSAGHP
mmetsp:Transcript_102078/g.288853  ORF Transcript_102078/g.288853 Transcript_102078/m.288853 type:complete len:314 (-) Transcript_102078:12-953(-)